MSFSLRDLQKYRNTIFLLGGMGILAITIASIALFERTDSSPLNPTPAAVQLNTNALKVDWSKIKLGQTPQDIETNIGKPTKTTTNNNVTTISYTVDPRTPDTVHEFTFQDNKLVRIKRNVDSHNEIIFSSQYNNLYGKPEIIRKQTGPEVYGLNGYKINNDEYVITETDISNNQVYNITIVRKAEYDQIKKSQAAQSSPDLHEGIEFN